MSPGWLRTLSTFCLGAALGILVGWGIADRLAPDDADSARESVLQPFPPAPRFPNAAVAGPTPAPEHATEPASPPDTLAGILQLSSDFEQTVALYNLISTATADDLQRLIGETDSVPGGVDRRAALSILYARYADLDAEAAVDHLLARPSIYQEMGMRAVFHAWARSNLAAAVARAGTLDASLKSSAGAAILLARHDLSLAQQRDITAQLDIEPVLHTVIARQGMDAVQSNPQAAWQAAAAGATDPLQLQQLSAITGAWARQDPTAAMTAVQSLNEPGLRMSLQQQVMREWSRRNARDAVAWALSQPPGPQRQQLVAFGLNGLADNEPREAFELAQSLDPAERRQAVGIVLGSWAAQDPQAAALALESVTDARTRRQSLHQVADHFVQRDADAAVAWLGTLDQQEAQLAASMVFSTMAHQDPTRAGSLVASLPEGLQADAAQAVVQGWAQRDPRAAAAWIDAAPTAAERTQLTQVLVQRWASYDRDAALRFANGMRSGAEREGAVVAIIQSQHEDPAFAESLYDELRLEQHQRSAAQYLYYSLQQSDPERAGRYRWAVSGARSGNR